MRYLHRLLMVVSAAFFIVSSALAQSSGTVTNHAFPIGKGAGNTGFTSLLCGSTQLAVGQAAADPICRTLSGDATLSTAGVLSLKNLFNVLNYGATNDCSTDSTAAINSAIVAARIASPSFGFAFAGSEVYFPPGIYCVSTIDATRTSGIYLRASYGSVVIYGNQQAVSRAIIDMTGSSADVVEGIIVGGSNSNGTDPAVLPAAGFLLADTTAGGQCNKNRITNSGSIGKFTKAALYILACTDNMFDGDAWQQNTLTAPTMFHSDTNDFSIVSSYATIVTATNPTGENAFYSNEFHAAKSASQSASTIMLKNAYAVRFYGGNNDANGTTVAHFNFQGTNNAIVVDGMQIYSENGTAAPYVFQSNSATINGLIVQGVHALFNAFSTSVFNGTGFTDQLVLSSPGLTSINWPTIPNGYTLGNVTGSTAAPVPISPAQALFNLPLAPPTRQTFKSGTSATYTRPAAANGLSPIAITVRSCGGGGGGGGSGTAGSAGNGGAGTGTTFSSITANPGAGANTNGQLGGAGGAAVTTSGSTWGLAGGNGTTGPTGISGATVLGAFGGGSPFFGGNTTNSACPVNSGAGGSGGFLTGVGQTGGGGGAGACREDTIAPVSSTYTYTVGTGGTAGTAGTSGQVGLVGCAGIIIVDEIYQ